MTDTTALVDRIEQGGEPSADDRRAVLEEFDLITVGMVADALRRRRHGARATFLRVAEVDDVVTDDRGDRDDEALAVGLWRLVGPVESLEQAVRRVEHAVRRAGDRPVTGFSLETLVAACGDAGALATGARRLRDEGLAGVAVASLNSLDLDGLAAVLDAGLAVERLILSRPVDDWSTLASRAAALPSGAGRSWRLDPLGAADGSSVSTGYDDVRLVALARIFLTDVDSIQVSWARHGAKLAQVALAFGADDIDAPVGDVDPDAEASPRRTLLAEIRRNIEAAGLEPVERGWPAGPERS